MWRRVCAACARRRRLSCSSLPMRQLLGSGPYSGSEQPDHSRRRKPSGLRAASNPKRLDAPDFIPNVLRNGWIGALRVIMPVGGLDGIAWAHSLRGPKAILTGNLRWFDLCRWPCRLPSRPSPGLSISCALLPDTERKLHVHTALSKAIPEEDDGGGDGAVPVNSRIPIA